MDIGKETREIIVEPVESPEVPAPVEPAPAPEREPVPA